MKKLLSLLLALVMCLSLLPLTAMAVIPDATAQTPYDLTAKELPATEVDTHGLVELTYKINGLRTDYETDIHIWVEFKIDDREWNYLTGAYANEVFIENCLIAPDTYSMISSYPEEEGYQWKGNETVYYRVYLWWGDSDRGTRTSYSNIATTGLRGETASPWTADQKIFERAEALGLIPDSLRGSDWTKPITRAEFAAIAVKVYESLSGVKAIPSVVNPFTDTTDIEVLKAYNVGITAGTAADKFSPNVVLNREQAATMLTRVFKRVSIPGWTLDKDSPLEYTKPAPFADDASISPYAKDSVYFMVANGIITGIGNNMFAPRAITSAEQATGYASATREQALAIAVRMAENLR